MVSWKPGKDSASEKRASCDGLRKMRTENSLLNLATWRSLMMAVMSCVHREVGKSLRTMFKRIRGEELEFYL